MRERERTRGIGVYLVLLHVDGSCSILGRKLGREQFPKPSCLLDVDAAVRVCTIGTVTRDCGRGEYVSGMGRSSGMLGATGEKSRWHEDRHRPARPRTHDTVQRFEVLRARASRLSSVKNGPNSLRHIGQTGCLSKAWSRLRVVQEVHSTCPHASVVGSNNSWSANGTTPPFAAGVQNR